jgi:hypothetical protein
VTPTAERECLGLRTVCTSRDRRSCRSAIHLPRALFVFASYAGVRSTCGGGTHPACTWRPTKCPAQLMKTPRSTDENAHPRRRVVTPTRR